MTHKWSEDIADRITPLNNHSIGERDDAKYILCWLQQTLRAYDNPAIDAAVELGNALTLPVVVYHGVREDYPHASDSLHFFLLGASRDVQKGCSQRGLHCVNYVERAGRRERGLVYRLADDAAAVLTDDHPVFVARAQAASFASKAKLPVFAVDTARLVPSRVLPEGLNSTPTFRKASGALRDRFEGHKRDFKSNLSPYEGDLCFEDERLANKSDAEINAIIAECDIDHSLPPRPQFPPNADHAAKALADFVANGLSRYHERRNNPAEEDGVSRLSPFLHFGVLGPRVITEAVRNSDASSSARWKYFDELLTWREYFHYLAYHDEAVGNFESLPEKPRKSLLEHADDPRPTLYSLSDLVHGRTDDETWNAAQRQWLQTGYMHNNLRMYWGKQIIKWTTHPEVAWKTACYLNDRLSLDGRDPATYGNMKWVFGMSKPGWREEPIYGWVAKKSDQAIRKRPGATEWLTKWATMPTLEIDVPPGRPDEVL